MNITDILGAPVNDTVDIAAANPPACEAATTLPSPSTLPPRRNRWLVATLVAGTLLLGIGAGWYLASRTTSESSAQTATATEAPVGLADFAEMFTALYLTGATSLADFTTIFTGTIRNATGTWVNQSAALQVEPHGEGFWVVTVAVDSLELVDSTYKSAGLQYFELTVFDGGQYPVAVSAPARIPGPTAVSGVAAPAFAGAVPADQANAITHFISGYLTGQQDIARYTTPTAHIQQFAEPPYESVAVDSMRSNSLGHVQTLVTATTRNGAIHALEYTVEMSFKNGVWEVVNLSAAGNSQ